MDRHREVLNCGESGDVSQGADPETVNRPPALPWRTPAFPSAPTTGAPAQNPLVLRFCRACTTHGDITIINHFRCKEAENWGAGSGVFSSKPLNCDRSIGRSEFALVRVCSTIHWDSTRRQGSSCHSRALRRRQRLARQPGDASPTVGNSHCRRLSADSSTAVEEHDQKSQRPVDDSLRGRHTG
jgi:hypothetical protein